MLLPALSFVQHGAEQPVSPIVLSVPHAGRNYPAALLAAIRVPIDALMILEDRHVDTLALAARTNETLLVQQAARAWIDLNRAEHERDPKRDAGAAPTGQHGGSAKLRSGLGLVPSRIAGAGEIWRNRLSAADVTERIAVVHRPYHRAIGSALAAARARFGVAVLLDIHSMPPLDPQGNAPKIVIGDRFGRSSSSRFVMRLEAEAEATGISHALNAPYAGGHILDRHASPARGIHAIQLEFDRSLYLDPRLDLPGAGMHRTAGLLRRMIAALVAEALAGQQMLAAE